MKRLKPSDEEEAEEEQPYDGEDGDDDENEEDDFDSGGGIFYGFDQLTRAASLTDPGMAPASGVAPTAPPLGSHAGLLAQLNAKYGGSM